MFGIIFGTICFIALMGVLRRRRWHRYGHHAMMGFGGCGPWGHHHGWGRGHFGHHHGWGGRGSFGLHGDGPLRFLFSKLETTHGQEQVLRQEWQSLRDVLLEARSSIGGVAHGASAAFAGEQFDRASAQALWQQHDAVISNVREAIATFMERAHGVLDAQQRAQVARMLDHLHQARGCC